MLSIGVRCSVSVPSRSIAISLRGTPLTCQRPEPTVKTRSSPSTTLPEAPGKEAPKRSGTRTVAVVLAGTVMSQSSRPSVIFQSLSIKP